jgi:hypothetical protein
VADRQAVSDRNATSSTLSRCTLTGRMRPGTATTRRALVATTDPRLDEACTCGCGMTRRRALAEIMAGASVAAERQADR